MLDAEVCTPGPPDFGNRLLLICFTQTRLNLIFSAHVIMSMTAPHLHG